MWSVKLTFIALVASLPLAAIAEPITYQFEGTIDDPIGTIAAGSSFQGSITYDTTSPEVNGIGDPLFGLYFLDAFEVSFGSDFIRIFCCTIKIDNRTTFDQFSTQAQAAIGPVEGGILGGIDFSTNLQIDFLLVDQSATALSSDALPGSSLTLADFPISRITLSTNGVLVTQGQITAFSAQPSGPLDEDGDGVEDPFDLCPQTMVGDLVDLNGCEANQAARLVIVKISTLIDSPVSDKARNKLSKAQDKLEKALAKLAEGNVKQGIKEESKAVKELLKAAKEGVDVVDLIELLVESAQNQAQGAIDAAIARGGKQNEIDKALDDMDKAQDRLSEGKPGKAIDHYSKAQGHAEKA